MNRIIKFRAWDKKNKVWFEAPSEFDSSLGKFVMSADGRVYINGVYQDLELMQFTGLTDKNGKEIYEGDVVSIKRTLGEKCDCYEIKFTQGMFSISDEDILTDYWLKSCEVIGNIYENPELLPPTI